jgi:hypothetical protein
MPSPLSLCKRWRSQRRSQCPTTRHFSTLWGLAPAKVPSRVLEVSQWAVLGMTATRPRTTCMHRHIAFARMTTTQTIMAIVRIVFT